MAIDLTETARAVLRSYADAANREGLCDHCGETHRREPLRYAAARYLLGEWEELTEADRLALDAEWMLSAVFGDLARTRDLCLKVTRDLLGAAAHAASMGDHPVALGVAALSAMTACELQHAAHAIRPAAIGAPPTMDPTVLELAEGFATSEAGRMFLMRGGAIEPTASAVPGSGWAFDLLNDDDDDTETDEALDPGPSLAVVVDPDETIEEAAIRWAMASVRGRSVGEA